MQVLNRFQFGMRGMLLMMALAAVLIAWYTGRVRFYDPQARSCVVATFTNESEVCVWELSRPVRTIFLRKDGKKFGGTELAPPFGENATVMLMTSLQKDGSGRIDTNFCNGMKYRAELQPIKWGPQIEILRAQMRHVTMSEQTMVLYTMKWPGNSTGKTARTIEVVVSDLAYDKIK